MHFGARSHCPSFWLKKYCVGDAVHHYTSCENRALCVLQVVILKAVGDLYAASIDSKIAMKVGPGDWSPEAANLQVGQKDWKLATSGPNYAIWEAIF
jgi:hypothetical protein